MTRNRTSESRRAENLRQRYRITLQQYAEMLEKQNGACAICGRTDPGHYGSFNVDHCHDTGIIRGLLCWQCNTAIGKFDDRVDRLQAAIVYLTTPPNLAT